ncbi:MAG: hypothetical protein IKU55_01465 [Clostridia bacterium]|nr:hypothetical protein [Clostridia bacterium]
MFPSTQNKSGRIREMNSFLQNNIKTIYRLRKIGVVQSEHPSIYAYVVSFKKDDIHTAEELVESFHALCKQMLANGETLCTANKCFTIVSKAQIVQYHIEAWKKRADRRLYFEDGCVKSEFLHRMSCEQAARIFKQHKLKPLDYLNTLTILQKYDNFADKYCALAKSPVLLNAIQQKGYANL